MLAGLQRFFPQGQNHILQQGGSVAMKLLPLRGENAEERHGAEHALDPAGQQKPQGHRHPQLRFELGVADALQSLIDQVALGIEIGMVQQGEGADGGECGHRAIAGPAPRAEHLGHPAFVRALGGGDEARLPGATPEEVERKHHAEDHVPAIEIGLVSNIEGVDIGLAGRT